VFSLWKNGIIAIAAFIISLLIGLLSRITLPMLILRPLIFAILFFALSGLIVFTVRRFLSGLFAGSSKGKDENLIIQGAHINIVEGDDTFNPINFAAEAQTSDTAKEDGSAEAQPAYSEEGLEHISGLLGASTSTPPKDQAAPSGAPLGVDQNAQSGYTGEAKGMEEMPEPGQFIPWEPEKVPVPETAVPKAEVQSVKAPAGKKPSGSTAVPRQTFSGDMTSADMLPDLDSMAGAFFSGAASEEAETEAYTLTVAPSAHGGQDAMQALPKDFDAGRAASSIRTVLDKDKEG